MKKLFVCLSLASCLSCGGPAVNPITSNSCERETDTYTKALTAWTNDISNKSKCEAVKTSLDKIVKNCSLLPAIDRKTYEESLKSWKCD